MPGYPSSVHIHRGTGRVQDFGVAIGPAPVGLVVVDPQDEAKPARVGVGDHIAGKEGGRSHRPFAKLLRRRGWGQNWDRVFSSALLLASRCAPGPIGPGRCRRRSPPAPRRGPGPPPGPSSTATPPAPTRRYCAGRDLRESLGARGGSGRWPHRALRHRQSGPATSPAHWSPSRRRRSTSPKCALSPWLLPGAWSFSEHRTSYHARPDTASRPGSDHQ